VGAVRFKSAAQRDISVLTALIGEYYAFDHIPFNGFEIAVGLRALIQDPSLARSWIIKEGTSTVGYVIVCFWFDLEFGGRAAALTDLYLRREHRRKGLGRRALKFVEEFCRKAGVSALELQVERGNTAARAFYTANGFVAHDRIPMSKLIPRSRTSGPRHRISGNRL
jgi:GNAT superfamily N-acetyltransferase